MLSSFLGEKHGINGRCLEGKKQIYTNACFKFTSEIHTHTHFLSRKA
jgi:hypothetical protein